MKANSYEYPDFDKFNTFPKLLKHRSEIMPDEIALRNKDLGIWNEITWSDYNKIVSELSIGLKSIVFKKGDVLALIGDNKPEWVFFELACHANGVMSLGLYRDTLDEEVGYLVKSAKVKFAYAEDQEQVDKLINVQKKQKTKIKVIYDDPRGLEKLKNPNVINMKDLASEGKKQLDKNNKLYENLINKVSGETVSVLCTTSGTTSNPKLAMLPANKFINHISNYLKVDPKSYLDEYVSVLPFPWIMEQTYGVGFNLLSGMKVNFPENSETAMDDLREIGPTFMLGAPRLWEQISADMRARILDSSKLTQWLFNKMVDRGLDAVDKGTRDFWADKLLFSSLKDRLGFSKVTSAATGGSAIGPETFKFFLAIK